MQNESVNEQRATDGHKWLCTWFSTVAQGEMTLEYLRLALKNHVGRLRQLFSELDRSQKSYITTEDLWAFMRSRRIKATPSHAYCIVKLYDSDSDGRMTEDDLRAMVVPTVVKSHRVGPEDPVGSQGLALLFSILISKEVDLIDQLSLLADYLPKYGISAYDAFSLIASHSDDSDALNAFVLLDYLAGQNVHMPVDSADLVIRRLDRDRDNKISYLDFMNSLFFHSVMLIEKQTAVSESRIPAAEKPAEDEPKTPPRKERREEPISGQKIFMRKRATATAAAADLAGRPVKLTLSPERTARAEKPSLVKKLTAATRKKAVEILHLLMSHTKLLEKERQELAQRVDFTLDRAWKLVNPDGGEYVAVAKLEQSLKRLGVNDLSSLALLLEKRCAHPTPDTAALSKIDFMLGIVVPQRKAYRHLLKAREKLQRPRQDGRERKRPFSAHTQRTLVWVLEIALEHIQHCREAYGELADLGLKDLKPEEVIAQQKQR